MKLLRFILLGLILLFAFSYSFGQNYQLVQDSAIQINVTGTSTLHGWKVVANEVKEVPEKLTLTGTNQTTIDTFGFSLLVENMDGGRGASMNKKITTALKASEYPTIQFTQNTPATLNKLLDDTFSLTSNGLLQIAGLEKEVAIQVNGQLTDGQLILKGSYPMKFSELEIEPPSAMFGQIVCGDDIAVNFEFRYELR